MGRFSVHLFVRPFVRPPPLAQSARPEAQPARSEAQPASQPQEEEEAPAPNAPIPGVTMGPLEYHQMGWIGTLKVNQDTGLK